MVLGVWEGIGVEGKSIILVHDGWWTVRGVSGRATREAGALTSVLSLNPVSKTPEVQGRFGWSGQSESGGWIAFALVDSPMRGPAVRLNKRRDVSRESNTHAMIIINSRTGR